MAGCAALVEMHCNGSDLLATLDLSGCHALRRLSVFNCRLASLDLSPCAALQELYCSFSGRIRALDLSGCAALRKVSLCNCGLQSLDVAGCGALTEANCSGNELERLELGSCALLRVLQCGQNKLARLDLSPCPQLDRLDVCSSPLLESLGTRGCSQLVAVECDDCPLLQDRLARCGGVPALSRVPVLLSQGGDSDGGLQRLGGAPCTQRAAVIWEWESGSWGNGPCHWEAPVLCVCVCV